MIDYLLDIITIGKYLISIVGFLGLFMLVLGLARDQRELVVRGGYLLLLALVLGVCGYFIYKTTLERADRMIYDYMEYMN